MLLMVAGLFTTMFFLTLYLAQVKGCSPIKVGLAYLPWPVAMAIAGSVAQQVDKRRIRPRIPLAVGLAFVTAGVLTLGHLPAHGDYASGLLPGLLLTAIGAGLAWANLFAVATTGVSGDEHGAASGIINTAQQLGAALGLAILSSIAAARTASLLHHGGVAATAAAQQDALVQGFQRGFFVGGLFVAVAVIVALLGIPRAVSAGPAGDSGPEALTVAGGRDRGPILDLSWSGTGPRRIR
jgi:predicted MFS family arabinose efflux permease